MLRNALASSACFAQNSGRNIMSYRETLPSGCPPETAAEISTEREVFRLVRTNPATEEDFRSQRAENPESVFVNVTECQARGLSVFARRTDSEKARRLFHLRSRLICRVQLTTGAGSILQTGRRSHHTWWPLANFDILAHCEVEEA